MIHRRNITISIVFIFVFVFSVFSSYSQHTRIMGTVLDSLTKEPLPFVNVIFNGTTIGATTNFEGNFSIDTKNASDTLVVSYVGYELLKQRIRKNAFQEIVIQLMPSQISLSEVVVIPGENPAEVLLRKVIANKEKNQRENFDYYQYELYNKIQFDANNITEKFKNRKIFKQFKFVFDYMDTSTVNGKAYLPMFITESLSEVYYRKSPKAKKEKIIASRVSGVENESISQFLGDMYQNINIYENHIKLIEKNFVSPVADYGLNFYKYYLIDSMYIDGQWCYQMMFKPRRKQELTFTGEIWIHDTTYAVKKVDMKLIDDANINFVSALVVKQEYGLVDNKYWMLKNDHLTVDFNVFENAEKVLGFFGHKTSSYKNFVVNKPEEKSLYSGTNNVIIEDSSYLKTDKYWDQARHYKLDAEEKGIYNMIDSVKSVPIFRTYVDILSMAITGYLKWDKLNIEIGPYITLLSFNEVEGARFKFGGRTTEKFHKRIRLTGHVAYGTLDEKFKYEGSFRYLFQNNPRKVFEMSYKYDVEQLGESQFAIQSDNLLSSAIRRNPANKLTLVEEFKGYYEHEWFSGFSNKIKLVHRDIYPLGNSDFTFKEGADTVTKDYITTFEVMLGTRFAYKEKYVYGDYSRLNLGTEYPVIDVQYSYGVKNFLESDYEFHKIQINLKHWFNIGTFGWSKYILNAGQIWGKLPYPLLKLHAANESYNFDEYAFNTMNYYEFISDRYVSLYWTHHFDGFFFNRVPLLRKLKWREVIWGRGLIGSLDKKSDKYSSLPELSNELSKPYFEGGFGIENIFKFLRYDFVYRFSYLDNKDINAFGLRVTAQFAF